jgi:hypothetical protein
MAQIRRKCFVSHHAEDATAVNAFINRFGPANFIKRGVTMPQDLIDSTNVDYVMRRVRELYVADSTVTIVLVGECTWARRFVDWEVQASLRAANPNGLLAIKLGGSELFTLPPRVQANVDSGYAKYHWYPKDTDALARWIDDAYDARTSRATQRTNPRDRYAYNRSC